MPFVSAIVVVEIFGGLKELALGAEGKSNCLFIID